MENNTVSEKTKLSFHKNRKFKYILLVVFAIVGATLISFSYAARPADITDARGLRGEVAIDILNTRLPEVAKKYNMAPEKLEKLFLEDETLAIDAELNLFYIEPAISQEEIEYQNKADELAQSVTDTNLAINDIGSENTGTVASAVTYSVDQAFSLNSIPGAPLTIFLDFDGNVTTGTAWNRSAGIDPITTQGIDNDGNPSVYGERERQQIINVWKAVADDFAAYNVNVTTQDPGVEKLRKTSSGDLEYGIRAVITADKTAYPCSCGGVAYVGSFNYSTDTPAWAYIPPTSTYGSEKKTAEIIAHEVGHTLGLNHDGTSTVTYYRGQGIWAPIMGIGYDHALSQFGKGEYAGANNTEDDLRIISGYVPYRADDIGDAISRAGLLRTSSDGTYFQEGIIGTTGDIDVHSFNWGGGDFQMTAAQSPTFIISTTLRGNLDPALRILDASGQEVVSSNPAGIEIASVNIALPAGVYYAEVRGVGYLDPVSTGYSNYGSLGGYILTGSASTTPPPPPANQLPVAVITPSVSTGVTPLAVTFSSVGSKDPENSILTYSWNLGNGTTSNVANPVTSYSLPGIYEVTLIVEDNVGQSATATTSITVTTASQFMTVSSLTAEKVTGRLNYSIVTVKVVDQSGNPVAGAVVTGSWSGSTTGTGSGTTGNDGTVLIRSKTIKFNRNTSRTLTFIVDQISHPSTILNYQWDSAKKSVSVTF